MSQPAQSQPTPARYERVDVLRALAMVWMTVFHFCFDLNYFGFIRQNFYADPVWTGQRSAIVSLFMFAAGLSQAVAVQQGQTWTRFWRRWVQVALCAALVSLGSWWVFPNSWIYFGVLHGLAIVLIVARWLGVQRLSTQRMLALAGLALVLPLLVQQLGPMGQWPSAFNGNVLNWLGLNWRKPITEDFVPVLPWLGPMLLGLAMGQWALRLRTSDAVHNWFAAPVGSLLRPIAGLGRWSLSYYMLHQPVLLAVLWLLVQWR